VSDTVALVEHNITRPFCIIQARMHSTRLPKKMLLTLQGETLILRAYKQAARIFGHDRVIIAAGDSDMRNYCLDKQLRVYQWEGPTEDVVSRFYFCAIESCSDLTYETPIVRWTPDDWRKDDTLIRRAFVDEVPLSAAAQGVETFPFEYLEHLYWRTPSADREHMGLLLHPLPEPPDDDLPWSIDRQADYDAAVAAVGK